MQAQTLLLTTLLTAAPAVAAPPETAKDKARALLAAIESGDPARIAHVNPKKYVQHNLMAPDGLAGLQGFMSHLPKGKVKLRPVRVFQDGDFVFTHSEFVLFGPAQAAFDVFRFEGGQIVEHWDNIQDMPASPNKSGRTMTDGPTQATDLDKTEANKKLVRALIEEVFVGGKFDRLAQYIDEKNYLQHNPYGADGLSGLQATLAELAKRGMTMSITRLHRVLGEGNFVLTMSEGSFGGKPTAYYDLFRVENGKVVEHWDTMETILPKDQAKNANGKF